LRTDENDVSQQVRFTLRISREGYWNEREDPGIRLEFARRTFYYESTVFRMSSANFHPTLTGFGW